MTNAISDPPDRPLAGTVLLVIVASVLLVGASAWPVVVHPGQRIFGTETVGRYLDPFTVIHQFAGAPVPVVYLQPATDWVGRALAEAVPPVTAYNIIVLMTFPLAAWFTFLFAWEITGSRGAAWVAAFAFAFAPFHFAHAAYHPHIAQVQWIPLYAFALWRAVHGFGTWRGLAVVAAAGVAVLANDYNLLVLAPLTPLAALLFWLTPAPNGERARTGDLLKTLCVLALSACAAVAALYVWMPRDSLTAHAVARTDLLAFSARWWSYLVPPIDHPLLGRIGRGTWRAHPGTTGVLEQQVYLGWTLLVLSAAGATALWRMGGRARRMAICLAALGAAAWLCSLKPEGRLAVVRPSAWLYPVAPVFRSYARFAVVVQLTLAVLAGAGVHLMWKRKVGRLAAAGALVLLVVEYSPIHARARDVLPTTAHRWLAEHAPRTRAFDCSRLRLGDLETAWLAGYTIDYARPQFADCGESGLASKLKALGDDYLLVRGRQTERVPLVADTSAGFTRVYGGHDGEVYRIDATPASLFLAAGPEFYPPEWGAGRTWRWMANTATIQVTNRDGRGRLVWLDLELQAFAHPRHATVSFDDGAGQQIVVDANASVVTVGPFTAAPGQHTLTLTAAEPAVSPASLGEGSDRRPLALRLFAGTIR